VVVHTVLFFAISAVYFCEELYTVSQKTAPLRQVDINHVIIQIQKIRNIRFVGNFILNKSCEFYYDDVTMTSFIGNK